MTKLLLPALFALSMFPLSASAGKIIVSPTGPATLSAEQAAQIFMGRETRVGSAVAAPVIQKGGAARDAFHANIVKRDPVQFEAHWSKLSFTGKGKPPAVRASDEEVVKFVESTPGAIGYVSDEAETGKTKVALDF